VSDRQMQIGEVAERTSLSLRTIRYYEEVGLAPPSARSQGRFRLYTERDVDRLLVIKRMKPLDFSLEEMRDLLGLLDELRATPDAAPGRQSLVDRLRLYRSLAEERIEALRLQLESAQALVADLHGRESDVARSSGGAAR
jgi:MerR family copper efflux transcriptional regulator